MVFVCFYFCHSEAGMLCIWEGILLKGVVPQFIWVDFDSVFIVFFRRDCPFSGTRECPFPSPGGATIFVNLRSKFAKTKNWRKSLCTPLRTDSWEISKKNPPQYFRAKNCAPIQIFSTCRYIVLAAIVKLRIGTPKMARNKQVCVHQKS